MPDLAILLRCVLLASGVVWFLSEMPRSDHPRPEAATQDRGSAALLRVGALVALIVAIAVTVAFPGGVIHPAATAPPAGLGLLWCGLLLRWWSIRTLGRYFTSLTVKSCAVISGYSVDNPFPRPAQVSSSGGYPPIGGNDAQCRGRSPSGGRIIYCLTRRSQKTG
jgi:hypothetical protein